MHITRELKGVLKFQLKKNIYFYYRSNSRKISGLLTLLLGAWRLGDTLAIRVGSTRFAKVSRP